MHRLVLAQVEYAQRAKPVCPILLSRLLGPRLLIASTKESFLSLISIVKLYLIVRSSDLSCKRLLRGLFSMC